MGNENKALREFVDLEVNELSVVDSPANEEEFIVIKCKHQEGQDMADKKKEVTKAAQAPAGEESKAPEETGAQVEKVAVDVEKAENDDVAQAIAKVNSTVQDIAKQLGVPAEGATEEKTGPRDVVEKQLKAAGLDDEAVKKSLEEYDAASKDETPVEKADETPVEKADETPVEKADETPVEKADETDGALDALTQLEAAISKAKRFTPQREETLKNAVEQLQKLLAALQPQPAKYASTPKNNLPSNASVGTAGLTTVTKSLEELTEVIKKSMSSIQDGQNQLAKRVEEVEKARQPSKAVGEDGTDGAEVVETKKEKSLWSSVI